MAKIPVRQISSSSSPERFSIRKVETLVAEADLLHALHRHDFFFLLLIEKGGGTHEIDFIEYPVREHSAFFVRPGQVHRLLLRKETSGFMIQFSKDFYTPKEIPDQLVLRKVSNKSHCRLQGEQLPQIFRLADSIFTEETQRAAFYKEAVRAYLKLLFIELSRQSERPMKLSKEPAAYLQERLDELNELLELHIRNKKQVSQYAEMMNLSPFQINQISKTLLQKTCSQLIDEHIILEAKRLLIASSDQVAQVADHLGYEDPSYFIRFFRKQTGQTPDSFRKNFT